MLALASLKVYSGAWHAARDRGGTRAECKFAGNSARKELLALISCTQ